VSTFTCRRCHKEADLLEEFPGRVCLDCWAQQEQHKPLPTAAEIAAMWDHRVLRHDHGTMEP
jgi:hypothetical protein